MSTFRGYVHETTGVFTLDPLDKAKFLAYAKRFKGEECEFDFRKRRTKRSDKQNRSYHALLSEWARSEGHDIEDLKDDSLGAVFGYREVVNVVTGEVKQVLAEPHTSTLNTQQFAELMDRTVQIAAECGVILDLPDEFKAKHKDRYPVREKTRRVA